MTPEPLKGNNYKGIPLTSFSKDKIKSALEWMIQNEEQDIEEAIKDIVKMKKKDIEELGLDKFPKPFVNELLRLLVSIYIEAKYESIQNLEAGLEDVI